MLVATVIGCAAHHELAELSQQPGVACAALSTTRGVFRYNEAQDLHCILLFRICEKCNDTTNTKKQATAGHSLLVQRSHNTRSTVQSQAVQCPWPCATG